MNTPPPLPIQYSCRMIESGKFLKTLYWVVSLSMMLMYVLIFLNVPVLLIVAATLGLMYFLFSTQIYDALYIFDESGITEELNAMNKKWTWLRPKKRHFPWGQVKSYLLDEEMTRSYGVKKFLKIELHHSRYKLRLQEGNEEGSRQRFETMAEVFVNQIQSLAQNQVQVIVRASFYQSLWGKFISLFLTAITLGLALLATQIDLSFGSGFKLAFVLIPGCIYLLYRSFSNSK